MIEWIMQGKSDVEKRERLIKIALKKSTEYQSLIKDPSLLSHNAAEFTSYPGGHAEGYPDSFKQCFTDFYRYISKKDFQSTPTFPTFEDGHREILLCEAILKSHQEARWIDV